VARLLAHDGCIASKEEGTCITSKLDRIIGGGALPWREQGVCSQSRF
jgi:hypothetical protein